MEKTQSRPANLPQPSQKSRRPRNPVRQMQYADSKHARHYVREEKRKGGESLCSGAREMQRGLSCSASASANAGAYKRKVRSVIINSEKGKW